jgi:hypothetical protein
MKSSFGTMLRFAAMVLLFAPAATAQAQQGRGQSICRDVWDWGSNQWVRVCNDVYNPPSSPPASAPPAPPVAHKTGSENTIPYNADGEERKAQLRAIELGETPDYETPSGSSLCPPPYRMTAQDGCQKNR